MNAKFRPKLHQIILLLAMLLFPAVVHAGDPPPQLRVFVSILPQANFVERIGDGRVTVDVLVRPGAGPEAYQPTPRQIAALAQSDLYMRIGVPFEMAWIDKIRQVNPKLTIVDTSQGIPRRRMESHTHEGEAAPHDAHEGLEDPHLWMDPMIVKQMGERIAKALAQADPAGKAVYESNRKKFDAELDMADRQLSQMLGSLKYRKFMIYHPALGYFADRYKLQQIPIQVEGKEPTARNLAEIINAARQDGIRIIFVQQQFGRRSAEVVAQAIGGRVETIDNLARDYINNLKKIAQAIAQASHEAEKK